MGGFFEFFGGGVEGDAGWGYLRLFLFLPLPFWRFSMHS